MSMLKEKDSKVQKDMYMHATLITLKYLTEGNMKDNNNIDSKDIQLCTNLHWDQLANGYNSV